MTPIQAPKNGATRSAARGSVPAWPTEISARYSARRPGGITVRSGSQVWHTPLLAASAWPGTWCGSSAIVTEVSTASSRAAVVVAQAAARALRWTGPRAAGLVSRADRKSVV